MSERRIIVEVWRDGDTWYAVGADGAVDSVGGSAEQVLSDVGDWLDEEATDE